jgi:hypothetical protein
MTEAIVTYVRGGDDISDKVTTLLVNRDLMRSFRVF